MQNPACFMFMTLTDFRPCGLKSARVMRVAKHGLKKNSRLITAKRLVTKPKLVIIIGLQEMTGTFFSLTKRRCQNHFPQRH